MLPSYQVVRQVSEGASADLFLARHQDTQERLIVEVVRSEVMADQEAYARFLVAARQHRALVHPNLARRIGAARTNDGRPCFITETVDENLHSLLSQRGPISSDEFLSLAIPLCDALQFLHERGIVHGNLTPASVFLRGGSSLANPKLIDYGLVLFRHGRPLSLPPGALVQTFYLAPERIRGQRATVASDIYGLGVLFFEALTGFPPFAGADDASVRRHQLEDPPPPLPPSCERVCPVIHRCLTKDPALRFGNAHAVARALISMLEQSGGRRARQPAEGEGDVLGSYQLVALLGEGAMGRVYRARHVTLGRHVALKLLKAEHASNRSEVQRFFQEAKAVNQINHPHIVEIVDFVDEPMPGGARRVFCVMEELRGKTLTELFREGEMTLVRGIGILRQVCAALEAAHRVGVVHRDVKPDNIFVTNRDEKDFVKVLDFGVAKFKSAPEIDAVFDQAGRIHVQILEHHHDHTAAGMVVGTPSYMSPEQVSGLAADHRVDIYAMGVVLYALLSGRRPFVGASFEELALAVVGDAPQPLEDRTPRGEKVAPALQALVLSCLEKEPGKRPASMAALGLALEPFLEDPDDEVILDPVEIDAPKAARRGRWVVPAAFVATAIVSATIALVARATLPSADGATPAAAVSALAPDAVARDRPAAAAPGAEAARKVVVRVESTPSEALVVRSDSGERLGVTPLVLQLPRTETVLPLEVRLERHAPSRTSIRLDGNGSVHVALLPEPAKAPSKPARALMRAEPKPPSNHEPLRDDVLDPFSR